MAKQEFHFSTGVKPYNHVPPVPVGEHEFVDGNGVKIIRFYCEDVPQGAQFQFASPYPNCKEANYENWIVREIVDGGLASKYAYFYLSPTVKNTVRIRITKMEYGRNRELFCNSTLMLRKARNVGDEETVNHYVLSRLNNFKGDKFDFETI